MSEIGTFKHIINLHACTWPEVGGEWEGGCKVMPHISTRGWSTAIQNKQERYGILTELSSGELA